jgi:hypothetical protein
MTPPPLRAAFADVAPALRAHLAGDADAAQRLLWRPDGRGGILRVPHPAGGTVVVKVWRVAGPRDRLKVALGIANGQREWRRHRAMSRAGLAVPAPIFYRRAAVDPLGPCEWMGIEDLGATERGVDYLKRLAAEGRSADMDAFEEFIADCTLRQLLAGILDVDNQLNNYLAAADGRLLRIDFECARRRPMPRLWKREYASMIDRLRRSHLHACPNNPARTDAFIDRLAARLRTPPSILRMADGMTRRERRKERPAHAPEPPA